jgi:hypothetical protein
MLVSVISIPLDCECYAGIESRHCALLGFFWSGAGVFCLPVPGGSGSRGSLLRLALGCCRHAVLCLACFAHPLRLILSLQNPNLRRRSGSDPPSLAGKSAAYLLSTSVGNGLRAGYATGSLWTRCELLTLACA